MTTIVTARNKYLKMLVELNNAIVECAEITTLLNTIRTNPDFGEEYHSIDHGYAVLFGRVDDALLESEGCRTACAFLFNALPNPVRNKEYKRKHHAQLRAVDATDRMQDAYLSLVASELDRFDYYGQMSLALKSTLQ